MNKEVYKLKLNDLDKMTGVYSRAFYDYPIFKNIMFENHNMKNVKIVFNFLNKYALLYSDVYANSKDLEGIIAFSDYSDYNFTLWRSLRAGSLSLIKLGKEIGNRFSKYDHFCNEIHKKNITEDHQYIYFLGVDPKKQGSGYGAQLLTFAIEQAKIENQPIYLETHGEKNLNFYQNFGFEVVSEDIVPNLNILQYAMIKNI